MNRFRLLVLAATALAALPGVAFAQIRSGTAELSPFYGRLFGGEFARGSNALFTERVDVDDANTWGLRLGYNTSETTEFEIQASRTDTHFISHDSGEIFGPGGERLGDLRIDYLLGYFTFNFGHQRAVPYVTIGAGAARLQPHVPGESSPDSTRVTGSLGIGLKLFFNPHIGVRIDGRGYSTYLNHEDRCGNFDRCENRHYLTNGEVTGGLLFAF